MEEFTINNLPSKEYFSLLKHYIRRMEEVTNEGTALDTITFRLINDVICEYAPYNESLKGDAYYKIKTIINARKSVAWKQKEEIKMVKN